MRNEDLVDSRFLDTFAHSGTRWQRNPTCWRYMDLLSLLATLHTEALHFTHVADLYRYDPHEGTGGLLINVVNDPIPPSRIGFPPDPHSDEPNRKKIKAIEAELHVPIDEQLPRFKEKVSEWDRANDAIYISSWHTN